MKGIRKLFLGLFFVALFSVGFKVDAKADITLGFEEPDWSINDGDSGSGLKANISATDPTDFPTPSTSATDNTYSVSVINSNDASGQFSISHNGYSIKKWNGKIYLITRKSTDGNSYYIAIGDSTPVRYTPTTTNPQGVLISDLIATRSDVKTEIEKESETNGVKTGEFKVNGNAPQIITNYSDLPIAIQNFIGESTNFDGNASSSGSGPLTGTSYSIYKVNLKSEGYGSATISFKDANENTITYVWLLPGESSGAITAVKSETSPTHIFTSFTGNGGVDSSSLTTDYSVPKTTFNVKTGTDAATGILTANYSEIPNTTISVSEGKSVYLSSFLNISSDVLATTTSSNISVTPNTKTSASSVIITGTSVGTATINVNGNSYSVKVYPKPTISGPGASSGSSSAIILDDDSKSGSSKAMSFTVPKIVRYDTPSGSVADSDISFARIYFEGNKKRGYVDRSVSGSTDSISGSLTIKQITQVLGEVCNDSCDVKITVYPEEYDVPSKTITIEVHKIKLNRDEGATYTVRQGNSEIISSSDSTETFYAIDGLKYNIKSSAKSGSSGMKFERWDNKNNKNWDTADGGDFDADDSKTFKAIYRTITPTPTPTPSPTPSPSNRSSEGSGMDGYDDVPTTGESKADIWILWSVLFVSILGAGFMIWKRFGLVRAIAEADEEVAVAEHKEEVKAKKKEKEDKIKMLKDLRNL